TGAATASTADTTTSRSDPARRGAPYTRGRSARAVATCPDVGSTDPAIRRRRRARGARRARRAAHPVRGIDTHAATASATTGGRLAPCIGGTVPSATVAATSQARQQSQDTECPLVRNECPCVV